MEDHISSFILIVSANALKNSTTIKIVKIAKSKINKNEKMEEYIN